MFHKSMSLIYYNIRRDKENERALLSVTDSHPRRITFAHPPTLLLTSGCFSFTNGANTLLSKWRFYETGRKPLIPSALMPFRILYIVMCFAKVLSPQLRTIVQSSWYHALLLQILIAYLQKYKFAIRLQRMYPKFIYNLDRGDWIFQKSQIVAFFLSSHVISKVHKSDNLLLHFHQWE